MATKTFIAGVGRALLFEGDKLFADCRTLADSSITVGVTAEDIRGGEGNKLWGQYFHDSSFNMKLTDIMFNMEYVAANVGSELINTGNVFVTEEKTAVNGEITLDHVPVSVSVNGAPKVFYRKATDGNAELAVCDQIEGTKVTVGDSQDNNDYCILYRYNDLGAQSLTVNAQFIPKTLHAVLTVALYAGDSCNVEAATKVGEVEIDIPRFQLSGAMDITMNATGASQTPLEGNALASGCTGCSGDGIYATITKVIFKKNWYDGVTGLMIEDNNVEFKNEEVVKHVFNIYACYDNAAPRLLTKEQIIKDVKCHYESGSTGLNLSRTEDLEPIPFNELTGTAATGTGTFTAKLKTNAKIDAVAYVTVGV